MKMFGMMSVPRRIFVDSCTAQVWGAYAAHLLEGDQIDASDPIRRVPTGVDDLEALRAIFAVAQRANFEWIISAGSLSEACGKNDSFHLEWMAEINAHAQTCLAEDGPNNESARLAARLDDACFGYLGKGDRQLIADAVYFRCHAFLTIERRLPKNAPHIQRELGIRILTPEDHWRILQPWASLWL